MNKMKKTSQEQYSVGNIVDLTGKQQKILNYFYLPLIGNQAFALYCFLMSESKNETANQKEPASVEKLKKFLNFTKTKLYQAEAILKKYRLLEKIKIPDKQDAYLFKLKKPVQVTKFFQNPQFYDELEQKIPTFWTEENYTKLKENQSPKQSEKAVLTSSKILVANSQLNLNLSVFSEFPNDKFSNFVWSPAEKQMVCFLKQKYQFSESILRILIDYILNKNHGWRIGPEYLSKIVEDLYLKKILQNENKIQQYFDSIKNKKTEMNTKMQSPEAKQISFNFPGLFK